MRAAYLVILVVPLGSVHACATVGPPGSRVAIASETVLIVWDEKTKAQHFIRRASFTTDLPYFGFLVPTPTQPKLAEAPDELFRRLQRWTEPTVKKVYVIEGATLSNGLGSGVDVLDEKRVGGFDAKVLRARDPEALRGWLDKHGYDARPQVTDWLGPYIKAGWVITAFQIAKKEKEDGWVETRAVRMSFQTDRPFFPYREPADQRGKDKDPARLLRVYVIAPQRQAGQLEQKGLDWRGRVVWAAPLRAEQAKEVTRLIDSEEVRVPEGAWLTELEDWGRDPLPGTSDLFFVPDSQQWTVRRSEQYEIVRIDPLLLKAGALFVLTVVGLFVVAKVSKRYRRPTGPDSNRAATGGQPMLDFLRDLTTHAEWANAVFFHIWGKSQARDHEELRRRADHIVAVQEAFLAMLRGETPAGPAVEPPPSFDEVKVRCERSHAELREFVASLSSDDLSRTVRIGFFPEPPCVVTVAEALVQVAMHTQHHRGQCMTRLKDQGGEPKNVDWIIWLWKQKPLGRWN